MINEWTYSQTSTLIFLLGYGFSISVIAYLFKYFLQHRPSLYQLKYIINEQESRIKSLNLTIKHLYDNIFELEALCENLMDELKNEENDHH